MVVAEEVLLLLNETVVLLLLSDAEPKGVLSNGFEPGAAAPRVVVAKGFEESVLVCPTNPPPIGLLLGAVAAEPKVLLLKGFEKSLPVCSPLALLEGAAGLLGQAAAEPKLLLSKDFPKSLLVCPPIPPKLLDGDEVLLGQAVAWPKELLSKGFAEPLPTCSPMPDPMVGLLDKTAALLVGAADAEFCGKGTALLGMVPQSSATGGREDEKGEDSIPLKLPPEEGRGGREAAALSTLITRPSRSCPVILERAVSASASDSKVTNPKPFGRPVSRSLMSFTSMTSPCWAKALLTASSSVRKDKPPTKSLALKLRLRR